MKNNMIACPTGLLAHRRQCLFDHCDALDEACRGLQSAIEALNADDARHGDDVAALEDIAGGLGRDLAAVQAELNRLDALERRSMGREALR